MCLSVHIPDRPRKKGRTNKGSPELADHTVRHEENMKECVCVCVCVCQCTLKSLHKIGMQYEGNATAKQEEKYAVNPTAKHE